MPFLGKGYATEIGKAVVANAFSFTDIEAFNGMTDPLNLVSIRVMEKIGMTCLGLQDFRGEQDLFYKIDRSSILGCLTELLGEFFGFAHHDQKVNKSKDLDS